MSRPPISRGISSVSSKPNAPSRSRASCSSAKPSRARTAFSRASFESWAIRGSEGGEPVVKAATTRPPWNTMAPSPPSISIDRYPVFRLNETI